MDWQMIGSAANLPDSKLVRFEHGDKGVVVLRHEGRLYAYQDQCSHQDVRMSDFGDVRRGQLICYAHGARFAIADGAPLGLPATMPLPCYAVKEEAGQIWIAMGKVCPGQNS